MRLGPRGERGTIILDPVERFWSKVEKTDGCWLWIGDRAHRGGYGKFSNRGGTTLAHRISYEMVYGPIPDGLVIDHLCREPRCVNPDHLEAVTIEENSRRAGQKRTKPACGRGHDMAVNGVARKDGTKYCGQCAADAQRGRRARNRAIRHARKWLIENPESDAAFVMAELLAAL